MPRPLREITRCARELTPSSEDRTSPCAWFVSVQRSRSTLRHHPHESESISPQRTGQATLADSPGWRNPSRSRARGRRQDPSACSRDRQVRLLVDRGQSVPSSDVSARFHSIPQAAAARGNGGENSHSAARSLLLHDVPRSETSDQGKEFKGARRQSAELQSTRHCSLLRLMTVIRDAFHTSDKSSYTQSRP
jgi:hypothetical protein